MPKRPDWRFARAVRGHWDLSLSVPPTHLEDEECFTYQQEVVSSKRKEWVTILTLTMAWIRDIGNIQELVVASDSRLTGGHQWDTAPKIICSVRGDCVIAFAGGTDFAYPMMIQMNNAIECYDKSASRQLALTDLKGHLVRVINDMLSKQTNFPPGGREDPDVRFLLAGYCWRSQGFRIWTIEFNNHDSKFVARTSPNWRGTNNQKKRLSLIGDELVDAKSQLIELLRTNKKLATGGFDMEPLEVLKDMIDNPNYLSIGGNPQLVKIYKSMKAVPFVMKRGEALSLNGRSLLEYEKPDRYPTYEL